jgi:bifunctional non-homologous end joining protein LigD
VTPPQFIQPCSPITASEPPTGERWTHEVKWDGFRFQVLKVGKEIRLFSRNGADWTERMPAIAAAFARLPARVAQIDGELCLCDAHGRPDFRALMRAARQRPADETGLSFHAFDLLQLNAAEGHLWLLVDENDWAVLRRQDVEIFGHCATPRRMLDHSWIGRVPSPLANLSS